MVKKTIKQRIFIGIKDAWNMELLPDFIVAFEKKIWVKLAKFIGSFAMFFILSGFAHKFNIFFYNFTFLISLVYTLYRIFLSLCAIIGYIDIVRKGKLLVRNSPLDLLTSCLRIIGVTTKTALRTGMGGGFTYALGKELDEYLMEKNQRPVFIPAIHKTAAAVGIDKPFLKLVDLIADQLEVEEIEIKDKDQTLSEISKETGLTKEEINKAISNAKLKKDEPLIV